MHTETGNIWTHFLAIPLFCVLFIYFNIFPTSPLLEDQLLLAFYLLSGICCWTFSTCFHTFRPHSKSILEKTERLDYCGILFYALSAFLPIIYYVFALDVRLKRIYLSSLAIVSLLVLIMTQYKPFARNELRPLRAVIFSSLFLVTIMPVIHAIYKFGVGVAIDEASLQSFLGFALAAAIGISFYSTEFPERFWPGKFDLFFHSHQIFHVWAVIGGLIHLDAIRKLQIFRLNFNDSNQTSVNI